MNIRELVYGWPHGVYLLLLIGLFIALFLYLDKVRRWYLLTLAPKDNLASMIIPRKPFLTWLRIVFLCLGWLCITLAMMEPLANGHYPEGALAGPSQKLKGNLPTVLRQKAHEVALLIDASASMGIKDTRTGQSRLEAAKSVADEVIRQLGTETVSVYAFTSDLTTVSPPTLDHLFDRLMLKDISINEGGVAGTDYFAALNGLMRRLRALPLNQYKTVVLISDGGDTKIESLEGREKEDAVNALTGLLRDSKQMNLTFYTVGVGSEKGAVVPGVVYEGKSVDSKLNDTLLKQLAAAGQGSYFNLEDYSVWDLASALSKQVKAVRAPLIELTTSQSAVELATRDSGLIYDPYFQYPLGLGIVFILLYCYLPDTGRVKRLFLWFLCLIPCFHMSAEDPFRQFSILYEAGEYSKARLAFEVLLKQPLSNWQKEVLIYDLGCADLVEQKWDPALKRWGSIDLSGNPSPLIVAFLKRNMALALLKKSMQISQDNENETFQSLIYDQQAIHLLEQSLKAACIPHEIAQNIPCYQFESVDLLLRNAKVHLAITKQRLDSQLFDGISYQDGIRLLKVAVSESLEDLTFLQGKKLSSGKEQQYVSLLVSRWQGWRKLWDIMKGLSKEAGAENSFLDAFENYTKGLELLEKGSLSESQAILNKVFALLEASTRNSNSLQGELESLYVFYQHLLKLEKFRETVVNTLAIEQKKITSAEVKSELLHANEMVDKALSRIREGHQKALPVYLEAAQIWITRALEKIAVQTPLSILQQALHQQQAAMRVSRSIVELGDDTTIPKNLLSDIQQDVIQIAEQFPAVVLNWQTSLFRGDKEPRCQASPWDEVLPLYYEGFMNSQLALSEMKQSALNYDKLARLQDAVLVKWGLAIELMTHPPKSGGGCQQGGGGMTDKKDQTKIQDVMMKLQEFNLDDKLPKEQIPVKKGARPW